jgi:hypothetical protein
MEPLNRTYSVITADAALFRTQVERRIYERTNVGNEKEQPLTSQSSSKNDGRSYIITGDEDSRKFIEVRETFGLIQHVMFPTHVSNNILDLIVTRTYSDIIIGEIQASFFLSDHCFVECNLSVPRPNPTQKELQFRRMRQINIDAFKSDIVTSNLCNETWANLNDLVQSYDETQSNILEKHAPVQRKVIMERTKLPWFNDELIHV